MPSREELQALSADWVAEGIISAEQRQRILARSRGDQAGVSRVVVILSVFGAAVVVLGLTLIVATNWENISFLAKLGAGVALMVAVDAAGYWLRFGRPALRKTGEALLLIGSGLLMTDLALVSQQYHILTNPAPILLLTWLAVATMPYFVHSRVYALVSAGLFVELLRDGSPLQIEDDAVPVFLCLAGAGGRRARGWICPPAHALSAACCAHGGGGGRPSLRRGVHPGVLPVARHSGAADRRGRGDGLRRPERRANVSAASWRTRRYPIRRAYCDGDAGMGHLGGGLSARGRRGGVHPLDPGLLVARDRSYLQPRLAGRGIPSRRLAQRGARLHRHLHAHPLLRPVQHLRPNGPPLRRRRRAAVGDRFRARMGTANAGKTAGEETP